MMKLLLSCWLLGYCFFLTVVVARAAAVEEDHAFVSIIQQDNRLLRRGSHHHGCSTFLEEEVCNVPARFDGNRLDLTTYCPINSVSYSQCTCSARVGSTKCTQCNYCQNTGVFILDCDNVFTRGCTASDCYGNCLSRKEAPAFYDTDRMSRDALAALIVFGTMCCLPCLTSFVCQRLLSRHDRQQQEQGGLEETLPNISPQDRKELIEKCLVTRKMDEEALQADLEGNLQKSLHPKELVTKIVAHDDTKKMGDEEESATSCTQASSMGESSIIIDEERHEELKTEIKIEKNDSIAEKKERDPEKKTDTDHDIQPILLNISLDNDNNEDDDNSQAGVDPCQICLEPFKVGDERSWSLVSDCQHSFHKECITTWLERHDDCPSCRAKYLKVNVVNGDE